MAQHLDLKALTQIIGPRFAHAAAERDASDVFVAEHYDVLKEHKQAVEEVARFRRAGVIQSAR